MVDTETGEFTEKTLSHEGNEVREFYAALEGPVVVGIEATGAMQWFLQLLEESPSTRHCAVDCRPELAPPAAAAVGSRTGAILRRFSLAGSLRFR
jgi:hypothetical protein